MKSLLHPLSYIAICILYSSMAILLKRPQPLLLLFILAWLLDWREGGRALRMRLYGLKKIRWIIFSIMLIQLLFERAGQRIMGYGIISIYEQGLIMAISLGLRLGIIYLIASSLSKLDFAQYKAAFSRLRMPEELSFMISYMAHMIPQTSGKFKAQMRELQNRGIKIRSLALRQKLSIYKILSIAAVADIILQSRTQAIALELRGFRSRGKRSSLHTLSFTYYDLLALIWLVFILVILL